MSLRAVTKNEAKALVQQGYFDQAVTALKSLIKQPAYAKDADCNKLLGQALCMSGRYEEAIPYLEFVVRSNKRSGAQWYLAIARQHTYEFEEALEALETYMPVLSSQEWLTRADSLMSEIKIGERAFNHIEDVVVIDSMLVPRAEFFNYYQLGSESGRVIQSPEEGIGFENLSGDHRIFSGEEGLIEQHRFQGEWAELQPVEGIGSEDFEIKYPFLRSDGETLYFACDSTPGMGGFDIYRTTFNHEEGCYYQPQRLGMPFNSPFDDYMMAIDETNEIGWWATERHATEDSVMIYLFILEDDITYLDESTISRARIDCIAETWREPEGYADLLKAMREGPTIEPETPKLHIVISNERVYTSESDFRNPQALNAYQQSVSLSEQISEVETRLTAMRHEYHQVGEARRKLLAPRIIEDEEKLPQLIEQQRQLVLSYRRLEQGL